jgi:Na+/H+ antiporter NhaC
MGVRQISLFAFWWLADRWLQRNAELCEIMPAAVWGCKLVSKMDLNLDLNLSWWAILLLTRSRQEMIILPGRSLSNPGNGEIYASFNHSFPSPIRALFFTLSLFLFFFIHIQLQSLPESEPERAQKSVSGDCIQAKLSIRYHITWLRIRGVSWAKQSLSRSTAIAMNPTSHWESTHKSLNRHL